MGQGYDPNFKLVQTCDDNGNDLSIELIEPLVFVFDGDPGISQQLALFYGSVVRSVASRPDETLKETMTDHCHPLHVVNTFFKRSVSRLQASLS
jgi:hypothetical protein